MSLTGTFNRLFATNPTADKGDPKKMSNESVVAECNQLARQAFDEINSMWRKFALISSVDDFRKRACDAPLETYGWLVTFPSKEILSRGYQTRARRIGRGAALKLNDVFWREVGKCGGPATLADAIASRLNGSLEGQMSCIEVAVSFLNGCEHPFIDYDDDHEGTVTFRAYHDFGVTARRVNKLENSHEPYRPLQPRIPTGV